MSQASPKWQMKNGRWIKVNADPQINAVNGTTETKSPPETPQINGFSPKSALSSAKVEPEPEPEPASNATPEVDKNNNLSSADIKFEDLIRGTTPEDIENRCVDLVKTYLSGSWGNIQSKADVTVTRISGGLTNQLYRVHLNDSVPRASNDIYENEPTDVAIKLYQEKHMKNFEGEDQRLNDTIILTIISEVDIGPKVYGIFHDGVILGYHPHEQFRAKHQQNPKLLRELATLLARIHHLNVPIVKSANLMMNDMEANLKYGFEKLGAQAIIDELKLENLTKKDIRVTFAEMLEHIKNINSPVIFSHHDFRGGNIMVTEPDSQLKIIDMEYCGYDSRGYDIGTFFTDWGKESMIEMPTYVLPPNEAFEQFAQYYIEACSELIPGYADEPENSLEKVVKEAKLFYAVQHMFFMTVFMKMEESLIASMPMDQKTKMTHIDGMYGRYNQIIEALIEDGTINKLG